MGEEISPEKAMEALPDGQEEEKVEDDGDHVVVAVPEDKENVEPAVNGGDQVAAVNVAVAVPGENVAMEIVAPVPNVAPVVAVAGPSGLQQQVAAASREVGGVASLLEGIPDTVLVEMCRGALQNMAPGVRAEFAGHFMGVLAVDNERLTPVIRVSNLEKLLLLNLDLFFIVLCFESFVVF
jgi:hypothetical protein